nr:hypothetical protein [Tanacetum cinerariifolium]
MPEDPYAYIEAAIQEPPPPGFIPEPVYLEFIPPKDDVLRGEEQPLSVAVSLTADSLGYIIESDPEEDDDEDPKEDPADYPTDKDDEEEESSGDDTDDDEEEDEGKDEEEEEHLAPADSVPPPAYRTTARMSIRAQTPIPFSSETEVGRLLAIPTPSLSPLTSYSSPLLQIPSLPLPTSPTAIGAPWSYKDATIRLRAESPSTSHLLPQPPLIVLPHTRASMVTMRVAAPSTYILTPRLETSPSGTPTLLPIPLPTSSPPLLLPYSDCRVDVPDVTLPLRKRLCIALGPRFEVEERSSAPTARPTRGFRAYYGFVGTLDVEFRRNPDREIYYKITDVWEDPYEIAEEIPATDVAELGQRMIDFVTTIRHSHARTARLMESEARVSREAWVQSMDANDTTRSEHVTLTEAKMTMTAIIRERVVEGQNKLLVSVLTLTLLNVNPFTSKDVAHGISWNTLMKMMTSKYCPRNEIKKFEMEIWELKVKGTDLTSYTQRCQELALMCGKTFLEESDKIEKYVGSLSDMIHGSVMVFKPKKMQDAVEFATELMDKKIHTFAERQIENKRKSEDSSRNNQNQQQQNKRQITGRAYTVGSGKKKPYEGSKHLCSKCNYHHDGQCAPKCHKCNRVGHLARDCRSPINANTVNNQRGTKAGGNGNAPAKVYVMSNAGTNPESNVVTGTFLLNNHYASILFDTGADRSFMSIAFSSQIDITPTILDHYYDVELADGRIVRLITIIRGCTLNFLNHPFNIDLMPIELGSFDVITGMDWLEKYQAVIVCTEKIIRILWGNETLIVRGDGSDRGNVTRLNIISCTKTHKYMLKGRHVFLTHVTKKKAENKSEGKRLEDVITSFEYVKKIFRRQHSELDMVIMPFGLTNASRKKKEHEEHLKAILELLKKEELYAKFSKCEF